MRRILYIASVISLNALPALSDQIVKLDYGTFEGFTSREIHQFLGIPYAQPPIGKLRFKPPLPPLPFEGIKKATKYSPVCLQYAPIPGGSEDCLTLNVFTPNLNPNEPYPVMVWVYGGAFGGGWSSSYNGESFVREANNSVVIVTMNYRTGAFGFLASVEAVKENAANMGLMDQQLAFEWVQKYIRSFGGDPDNITVFGESAGAVSIALHLVRYGNSTKPPFHKAIVQSGGPNTPILHPEFQQQFFDKIMKKVGCKVYPSSSTEALACLRGISPNSLAKAFEDIFAQALLRGRAHPFGPIIDGKFIKKHPIDMLKETGLPSIPLMMGSTTDEGTMFTVGAFVPIPINGGDISAISVMFPMSNEDIKRVDSLYPISDYKSMIYSTKYLRLSDAVGDAKFKCPQELLFQHAKGEVYRYRFNQLTPFQKTPPYPLLVNHGDELPYLWPSMALGSRAAFTANDRALARVMSDYWVCFAKTGNPNCKNNLIWPEFTSSKQRILLQEPGLTIEPVPDNKLKCNFWNSLYYKNNFN
ncbi:uncharacterized protein VTP21DRAFT_6890 [Calcarisporiella thermophila]|uniref:uncharacterized protein n=1 Tax=Calcarisporiella thermophila TaxID=911321 RepID=UPI00374235C2